MEKINGSLTNIQVLEFEEDKVATKFKDSADIFAEKFKLKSNDGNYSTTFLSNNSNYENQVRLIKPLHTG